MMIQNYDKKINFLFDEVEKIKANSNKTLILKKNQTILPINNELEKNE